MDIRVGELKNLQVIALLQSSGHRICWPTVSLGKKHVGCSIKGPAEVRKDPATRKAWKRRACRHDGY